MKITSDQRSAEVAISIRHLYKRFGEQSVLNDIHHDFSSGAVHGLVGNNGSGKTVLMKCICGFLLPSRGQIFVGADEIGKDRDFPADLGLIIETPGFLNQYSGLKNLLLLASLKGRLNAQAIMAVLERVGLAAAAKKKVGHYSLGMRQRLGIAQAIMENPQLLILDEPFNGLDKRAVADMHNLVLELKGQGKTILLASHNQVDIDELCDTVCEMDGGVLTRVR